MGICSSSAENNGIAAFLCEDLPRYANKEELVRKYWNHWDGEHTNFFGKRDPQYMRQYLRHEMWGLDSSEKFEFSLVTPQKLKEIMTLHFPSLAFPPNVFELAIEMAFDRSAISLLTAMETEKILPGEVKSFEFNEGKLKIYRIGGLPALQFKTFLRFLSWCMHSLPEYKWERAAIELLHSFQCYALGMCYFHGPLKASISPSENLFSQKRPPASLFFEQLAAFHGHPYHPCYKTKLPLSASDIIKYSPEYGPAVPLSVYAIHESAINAFPSFMEYRIAFWEGLPDELAEEFRSGLKGYDLTPEMYAPWLCHPMNEENVRQVFQTLVEKWQLVRLPMSIDGTPTLSFRTFDIMGIKRMKLTTPVQATSLVRYVSPVEANLGAHCRRLRKIMRDFDPDLNVFAPRYEMHSLHARFSDSAPDEVSPFSYQQARFMSIIIRDHPKIHQRKNCIQMSLAGLIVKDPHGRLVLSQFLDSFTNKQVCDWFSNYVDVTLRGHLDLFLLYGAALESHQQNVILELNTNTKNLERTFYHDISGIYWEEGLLEVLYPEQSLLESIYKSHDDTINSLSECIANVHHTLFKSNLFTVAKVIAGKYCMVVDELNEIIRVKTRERFDYCREVGVKFGEKWVSRFEKLEKLFYEKMFVKCLLKMRLMKTQNEQRIHITNPLVYTNTSEK